MKQSPESKRVVFFPDLIFLALANDPSCRTLLNHWRDGEVRPVLNRELLQRQLKLLARLALTEKTLRKWIWWLTSEKTSAFVTRELTGVSSVSAIQLCQELADVEKVPIVYGRSSPQGQWPPRKAAAGVRWISAAALVAELPPTG